jgi:hypothetical protein
MLKHVCFYEYVAVFNSSIVKKDFFRINLQMGKI